MGNSCCNFEDDEEDEVYESPGINRRVTTSVPTTAVISTQPSTTHRGGNIKLNIRSTEQNTNYRERNNITSTRIAPPPRKHRKQNSDRDKNFAQPTEYRNSKQDYNQSQLSKDLENWSKEEKIEKVCANNSIQSFIDAGYAVPGNNVLDRRMLYELEKLDSNSWEYQKVVKSFFKTNKRFFKIHSIEKVHNPYLLIQYEMKKRELTYNQIQFTEELMYHGTKKCNVDSICQTNFNWRLSGTARGSKFGKGVSFSPIAYYATHYGDTTYNKVMIVANVLVGNCCQGYRNMLVPQLGCDTSVNEKKHVYVKYDDNTFYPRYLIHYGGIDEKDKKKEGRNDEQYDFTIWD